MSRKTSAKEHTIKKANQKLQKKIKDQKKIKGLLSEQLDFIQKLLHSIPNPIWYKDIKGRYLGCNQRYAMVNGIRQEEIIDLGEYDIFTPLIILQ